MKHFFQVVASVLQVANAVNPEQLPVKWQVTAAGILGVVQIIAHVVATYSQPPASTTLAPHL